MRSLNCNKITTQKQYLLPSSASLVLIFVVGSIERAMNVAKDAFDGALRVFDISDLEVSVAPKTFIGLDENRNEKMPTLVSKGLTVSPRLHMVSHPLTIFPLTPCGILRFTTHCHGNRPIIFVMALSLRCNPMKFFVGIEGP